MMHSLAFGKHWHSPVNLNQQLTDWSTSAILVISSTDKAENLLYVQVLQTYSSITQCSDLPVLDCELVLYEVPLTLFDCSGAYVQPFCKEFIQGLSFAK